MRTLLASLSGWLSAVAQAQLVSGSQFQVNQYTTSDQSGAAVANVGPSCNFVLVWSSDGQDGSETAVVGRLFDASGAPTGGDFLVNVTTTGVQGLPSVASNPAGNFVVTWSDGTSGNPGSYEVRARRFDASGTPQGGEISVNTHATGQQAGSSVALDGAGNFVVVWQSGGQDGDGAGVFQRRFDANGNPLSGDVQINQHTTGDQTRPRIAMNPGGDFVVAWESAQDAQAGAVMARRYDNAGSPLGGEFQVNTVELDAQYGPDVALDPDGKAIVVWTSYAQDGSDGGVYAQRLDASGNKLGPEFSVNAYTNGPQGHPRVVAGLGADQGEFTIIFQSDEFDSTFVRTETFHPDGRHYGILMHFYPGFHPAIAAQPNGQFVTAWESDDFDSDGIAARVQGIPRVGVTQVDPPTVPAAPSGSSNQNGILEVGELVNVEPSFRNFTASNMALLGAVCCFSEFFGDDGGLIYEVPDGDADYGTSTPGAAPPTAIRDGGLLPVLAHRHAAGGGTWTRSTTRSFRSTASTTACFATPSSTSAGLSPTYRRRTRPSTPSSKILVHNGITGGCAGGGNYCPLNNVTRGQMAAFLLRARWEVAFFPAGDRNLFPRRPRLRTYLRAGSRSSSATDHGGVRRRPLLPERFGHPTADGGLPSQDAARVDLRAARPAPETSTSACPSLFADWIEDLADRGASPAAVAPATPTVPPTPCFASRWPRSS